MSEYSPDLWAVVKISSPEYGTVYKILGSWFGGFGGSNSWKLSSGIVSNKMMDGRFDSLQDSGSTYSVGFGNYGMNAYTAGVFTGWQEALKQVPGSSIELFTEEMGIEFMKGKIK